MLKLALYHAQSDVAFISQARETCLSSRVGVPDQEGGSCLLVVKLMQ